VPVGLSGLPTRRNFPVFTSMDQRWSNVNAKRSLDLITLGLTRPTSTRLSKHSKWIAAEARLGRSLPAPATVPLASAAASAAELASDFEPDTLGDGDHDDIERSHPPSSMDRAEHAVEVGTRSGLLGPSTRGRGPSKSARSSGG
jgi:hypothetical protein